MKMSVEQKERLHELKSKYFVKYIFTPKLENLSKTMPFSFNILKDAALKLRSLK